MSLLAFTIRLARGPDLERCVDVERRAAARFARFGLAEVMAAVTTPYEHLSNGLRAGRLVVADVAGEVVGFALVSILDGEAHLEELDVVPEHGQRGIGRALVVAALAVAKRERAKCMTLSTLRDIPWNAPWYARLGFREMREDEIGPELAAACTVDRERGLPNDGRVLMLRPLDPGQR